MKKQLCLIGLACLISVATVLPVRAQLDPVPRKLLQLGVDQSLKTDGPMGAYAFYYWNMPTVPTTNTGLRLAIAPGYVDGELGFKKLLGENTDLGLGFFGGLNGNNYNEVDGGDYDRKQSFVGDGGGARVSVYHCFNPASHIPLNGMFRAEMNYIGYDKTDDTASNFEIPDEQAIYTLRTGLRWGGKEPMLGPTLAMEVSGWYWLEYRANSGDYGYADDHDMEETSHKFLARAMINYTTLESKHYITAGIVGGAVLNPDRLSAWRVGGVLPFTSEFPLFMPGYFYGELSCQDFGLLYSTYTIPFGESKQWSVMGVGAAGVMKYVDGTGQSGAFNSGVGLGGGYAAKDKRWKVMTLLGYGINAERSGGDGGYSLGLAFQYNFGDTVTASDRAYEQLENKYGTH